MKRNFISLFTIVAAVILVASIPFTASGQITLNMHQGGKVTIGLAGSDKATIDWGDGSPVETYSLKFSVAAFSHTYSSATPRTITITGDKIRGLVCTDLQLTSLDVSKCTALSILDCSRNKLTSIDLSKNEALRHLTCTNNQLTNIDVSNITWIAHIRCSHNQLAKLDLSNNVGIKNLYCDNNQLQAAEMGNFLRSLHRNVINGGKSITIADNPGLTPANASLAREVGWTVREAIN